MASSNKEIVYNLPARIKETRKEKKMSQTELGLAMGTTKSAISNLEKGVHVPDLETVLSAADAMNTPLSAWFGEGAELDPYLRQFCERAKKVPPEKKEAFEALLNAALNMAGV